MAANEPVIFQYDTWRVRFLVYGLIVACLLFVGIPVGAYFYGADSGDIFLVAVIGLVFAGGLGWWLHSDLLPLLGLETALEIHDDHLVVPYAGVPVYLPRSAILGIGSGQWIKDEDGHEFPVAYRVNNTTDIWVSGAYLGEEYKDQELLVTVPVWLVKSASVLDVLAALKAWHQAGHRRPS